jgi:hypothetical protein
MSIPSSPSYDSTGSYDGIGKFKNNANGTLASAAAAGDTTINLTAGHGNRFPTVNASENEYFFATLIDTSGNLEVVKVTARATDSLTVVRAQDGTSAIAFSASDIIELRPTSGALDRFLQVTGPQTGHNKKFINSEFAGGTVNATTLQVGGVDAVSLSGTQTLTNKTLTDPVINGTMTGTANFIQTGMIVMWSGTIANIPTGWVLCDGTNSTPNLTDKFIVGAAVDSGGAAKTNIEGTYEQSGGSNDSVVVTHTHNLSGNTGNGGVHHHLMFRTGQSGDESQGTASSYATRRGVYGGDMSYSIGPVTSAADAYRTSSSSSHSHSLSSGTASAPSGASDGVNKNIPEYFALAFIMKT